MQLLIKILISIVGVLVFIFLYYQFWFLRQPERNIPLDNTVFVSPANGKIIAVKKWNSDSLQWDKDQGVVKVLTKDVDSEGWLIAIEMDISNVHYQRAPIKSTLISKEYTPGKFKNALIQTNEYGMRLENERNSLLFETESGLKYKVIQIAGLVARRIVDYIEPNQKLDQGDIIGLIKLGSQVSLILPSTLEPAIGVGDKVIDGETIIAKIK